MRRGVPALALWLVLAAAPGACLFPDYAADLPPAGGDGGSGGSSRASSSASSTGSGASTSSGAGGESCLNGLDDDADGKVDCDDPACGSVVECAAEAPTGFQGPVRFAGPIVGQTPVCDAGWTVSTLLFASLDAPPAACACSCVPPTPTCTASVTEFADTLCATPTSSLGALVEGACQHDNGAQLSSAVQSTPTVNAAPCNVVPLVDKPAASFTSRAVACGASQARGCAAGSVCVPRAGAAFPDKLCVVAPGDRGCPASYPNKQSFFEGGAIDDTRGCSADCACGVLAADCAGSVSFFSQPNCGSADASSPTGACGVITPGTYKSLRYDPTDGQHSCPATGAPVPTGGAVAAGAPTTVCCR